MEYECRGTGICRLVYLPTLRTGWCRCNWTEFCCVMKAGDELLYVSLTCSHGYLKPSSIPEAISQQVVNETTQTVKKQRLLLPYRDVSPCLLPSQVQSPQAVSGRVFQTTRRSSTKSCASYTGPACPSTAHDDFLPSTRSIVGFGIQYTGSTSTVPGYPNKLNPVIPKHVCHTSTVFPGRSEIPPNS